MDYFSYAGAAFGASLGAMSMGSELPLRTKVSTCCIGISQKESFTKRENKKENAWRKEVRGINEGRSGRGKDWNEKKKAEGSSALFSS